MDGKFLKAGLAESHLPSPDPMGFHSADQGLALGGLNVRELGQRHRRVFAVSVQLPSGKYDAQAFDYHRFNIQLGGNQSLHRFALDGRSIAYPAFTSRGTISFVPAGQSLSAETEGDFFEGFRVLIPRSHMQQALNLLTTANTNHAKGLSGFIGRPSEGLERLAYLLLGEYRVRRPAQNAMVDALVDALCIELARMLIATGSNERDASGFSDAERTRVLTFFNSVVERDMSLKQIAEELSIEPYELSRRFRRSFKESPSQFLMRLRIERALKLLSETDLPIAQVAIEAGFSSQSHLTSAFSKHVGITPARHRKQLYDYNQV